MLYPCDTHHLRCAFEFSALSACVSWPIVTDRVPFFIHLVIVGGEAPKIAVAAVLAHFPSIRLARRVVVAGAFLNLQR